jgi:hypothetical protein
MLQPKRNLPGTHREAPLNAPGEAPCSPTAGRIADFVLTAGEASPARGVKPGPFGQRS